MTVIGRNPRPGSEKVSMSLRQICTALLFAVAGSVAVASPIVTNTNVALKTSTSGAQTAGFSTKHTVAGLFTDTFTSLCEASGSAIRFVNWACSFPGESRVTRPMI